MARYPLGQPVRVSTTVRDVTGALVNATTLTLLVKIANADGTSTTTGTYAAPTLDSTGTYHQDVPAADLAALGHYQYTWTATGTGAGVSPPAEFDVYDPFETRVLALQDAKDMLNIPQAATTSDAELESFIATIETSLEGLTGGPIVNRVISAERAEFSGWYQMLQVRQRPLVSVTSITSARSGTVIDISGGLDINPAARTIRRKDGSPFSTDSTVALVTYVAGWGAAVPAAVNSAARIILKNLWDTQRGATAAPMMGGGETAMIPGFAFAIPSRAAQLLNGTLNGMPFADQVFAW
jgi:hypothetical protein